MKPFNKVFVALDDSHASNIAVDYAARLAHRADATITFCHSVDLAGAFGGHSAFTAPNNIVRLSSLRRNGQALLARAQATADARAIPARGLELVGSTAAATVNVASRRGASAIVVGTEAARRNSRSLGLLAEDVLRLSEQPVILVFIGTRHTRIPYSSFCAFLSQFKSKPQINHLVPA